MCYARVSVTEGSRTGWPLRGSPLNRQIFFDKHPLLNQESNRPPSPDTFKTSPDTPPISNAMFLQNIPSPWSKVVYTPPICITMLIPFVLQCLFRSLSVRGFWEQPPKQDSYTILAVLCRERKSIHHRGTPPLLVCHPTLRSQSKKLWCQPFPWESKGKGYTPYVPQGYAPKRSQTFAKRRVAMVVVYTFFFPISLCDMFCLSGLVVKTVPCKIRLSLSLSLCLSSCRSDTGIPDQTAGFR